MSDFQFYDGAKVRLRDGGYDEIIPCLKRWQLKRVGLGVSDSGRVLLVTNDQYDVVEILPPEPPTPTVELGKWYPCRDGVHEGKVLEGGLPGISPLVGVVRKKSEHASWFPTAWTTEGKSSGIRDESDCDLILTPPEPKRHKVTLWANCYVGSDGGVSYGSYGSKLDADRMASPKRKACVPYTIEFVKGEGLS